MDTTAATDRRPRPTTSFGGTRTVRMPHLPVVGGLEDGRTGVPRGNGQSYGDQSLCSGGVAWRAPSGVRIDGDEVEVGAGTDLATVLATLWPTGRTLPVVPGSLAVTVGGAIAADVHGKNHPDAGTFGGHVTGMRLATPDASRWLEPGSDAFDATTGGMGLTGAVTAARLATVDLPSGWAHHRVHAATGIGDLLDLLAGMLDRHEHAAAWIDLAGPTVRGLVEGTTVLRRPPAGTDRFPPPPTPVLRLPRLPLRLIRRGAIRALNNLRWRRHEDGERVVPLGQAIVPLAAIDGFEHAYGPAGLVQHQVVVPDGREHLVAGVLEAWRSGPVVPALVVLKRLGAAGSGHLSFPLPGWTLAADFPAGDRRLGAVLDEVDRHVATAGGRIYLAKDATAQPGTVARMYPRLDEWRAVARGLDPNHAMTSDLDRRLGLRVPHDPIETGGDDA